MRDGDALTSGGDLRSRWDIQDIMRYLRHRYPFLLVDRIIALEERRSVTGFKNVTINEPFFTGHFPGHPVMPGVLIIEAMSQVAACLAYADPALRGRLAYLVGVDDARFRRVVIPGDRLMIHVESLRWRLGLMKVRAKAHVEHDLAAEALLLFQFVAGPGELAPGAEVGRV
jgi:3-hydroxyacyl-[acyl-carrier-protein] dehydratase